MKRRIMRSKSLPEFFCADSESETDEVEMGLLGCIGAVYAGKGWFGSWPTTVFISLMIFASCERGW